MFHKYSLMVSARDAASFSIFLEHAHDVRCEMDGYFLYDSEKERDDEAPSSKVRASVPKPSAGEPKIIDKIIQYCRDRGVTSFTSGWIKQYDPSRGTSIDGRVSDLRIRGLVEARDTPGAAHQTYHFTALGLEIELPVPSIVACRAMAQQMGIVPDMEPQAR